MRDLTGAQKKHLRGLAHHLKPLVQVGRNGLTESVVQSIAEALENHELIKVRLADPQGQKRELAEEVAERTGSVWVGLVGHVVTLYRQHPDPEERRIELP
jgi:RNA-binding protein